MSRLFVLSATLAAAVLCAPGLSAQVKASDTPAEKNSCTANQHNNDGRVSYAEVRDQTLTQSAMNKIRPSINGGAKVHGWAKPEVLVKACIQTYAPSDAEARSLASQVTIARGPGEIEPQGPKLDREHYWNVSYEVWLPNESNVDLKSMNGGLAIDDVHGDIRFDCLNGGVQLRGLSGDVDGSTVNGGIHVKLSGDHWDGKGMRVSTTNGGVHIEVPGSYSANFESSTVNGGVHNDFSSGEQERRNKNVSVQVGSGGATIHATTVNGGVHISRIA